MAVQLYLHFNGNANEALDFYQNIFKGEVFKMPYGEMPPDENFTVPDEMKNKLPFAETFWAKGYGLIVDRFGIYWHVNVEQECG